MVRMVSAPAIRPDLDNWSNENGGRGRFNGQLNGWYRSRDDIAAEGARRGYDVNKT